MFIDDLKFSWRQLTKSPGFSFTAILTLAVAIGANTAVFSLVDAALIKPLPYPQPERLATFVLGFTKDGATLGSNTSHTGATWEFLRDNAKTVDVALMAGLLTSSANLVAGDRVMTARPLRVSAGYFRVLGVTPALGREFLPDEDRPGGATVTILSDRLWQTAFNADPGVLGKTILLKGEPHTVVGIMPPRFRMGIDADLWTPARPSRNGEGGGQNYGIITRLHDGVNWAEARADVANAADPSLRRRTTDSGATASHSLTPMQEDLAGDVRTPLLLLLGSVALVLLVACVNLAGLLLARAGRRTRELATRLAVGGDRKAIIRQLLVESVVLAMCGGAAGLVLGALALSALKLSATDLLLTAWADVVLDGRVLGVTLALTAMTAVLFGLVPAIQATRLDVQAALAEGGTRSVAGGARGWSRRILVIAEVALGVVLLVGAGLLIRTFVHLQSQPPGIDPMNVVAAAGSLEDARYQSHDRVMQLFDDSVARLRSLPGVESATVSLGLPYQRILNNPVQIIGDGGKAGDFRLTSLTYVTPGYFETLKLPIRQGRALGEQDRKGGALAVVVNEAFATKYLDGVTRAVGRHVQLSGAVREVVGVADNVQQRAGFQGYGPIDALPQAYMTFAQFPEGGLRTIHGWFSTEWLVRSAAPGAATEQAIRRAMAEVDPQLPLSSIRAVDAVRSEALARQRIMMTLVAMLGAAALFLAAIGIHALIASGVTERTREFGIRMALGATATQTIWKAATPGIVLAVIGLAIGCVAAYGASGLVRSLLWGVTPNDPITFAGVVVALLVVATAASVLPALRIRRLDPVELLRE